MITARVVLIICGLSAACCAPSSSCHTKCHFVANTLPKGWTCDDVQNIEDAAQWAFRDVKDKRLARCDLKNYHLKVMPEASWWLQGDGWGMSVVGVTYCDDSEVVIATRPPFESSLAHEFAHVLQDCKPLEPFDKYDFYHSNWDRDGIHDAIEKAKHWDGGE